MLFCVLRVSTHYFYISIGLCGVESFLPFRCQDCNQVTGPKPYIELKEADATWSSNVIGWMPWASGWWSTWPGSCCWSVGSQAMRCSTCPQCRELCCKNTYFFGCCFFPLLLDSCSAGVLCPKVACIPCAKQVKGRRVVCRCALWKVLDSPWYEVRTHPMSMYASFSGLFKSVVRCPDKESFSQSPYATTPLSHCSFAKVRTDLRDIWPVPFSEVVLVQLCLGCQDCRMTEYSWEIKNTMMPNKWVKHQNVAMTYIYIHKEIGKQLLIGWQISTIKD